MKSVTFEIRSISSCRFLNSTWMLSRCASGQGAVGRLGSQLAHAEQDVARFIERAFSRLHERDAVVGVTHRLVHTADAGLHVLGNGQTRRVIAGAVDAETG